MTRSRRLIAASQPDEEERREEAVSDREELLGEAAGFTDRGKNEPEGEAREHDRHVSARRQRCQRKEDHQIDPEFECKLLRFSENLWSLRQWPDRWKARSTKNKATAHAATANAPTPARGALSGSITKGSATMQTVSAIATWAVICRTEVPPSPQRIDDGENQRRGRRRDQDRVQRGVTGAECRRRTEAGNNRQKSDDNRANGTLADCRTNCRIADRGRASRPPSS